jgi:hypothetical protein
MSTIQVFRLSGTFIGLSSHDAATGASIPAAEAQFLPLFGNGDLAGFLTANVFTTGTPIGNDGIAYNAVVRASASAGSVFVAVPNDMLADTFLFDTATQDILQVTASGTNAVQGTGVGSFVPTMVDFKLTDSTHMMFDFAGGPLVPLAQLIPDSDENFDSKLMAITWSSGTQSVTATFDMNVPVLIEPSSMQTLVFRFYNTQNGVHVYTSSEEERDDILFDLPQYNYEGPVFATPTPADPNAVEVYRFFNGNVPGGAHFYTTSVAERDQIVANADHNPYLANLILEGVGLYAYDHMVAGATPVYRFFNGNVPGGGAHFYTSSQAEYQHIIDNPDHDPYLANLHFELIAYYVLAA